ncbi:tail protein X [Paenibacillus ehimensis]|uniref:tail protein X n=1 Tax=Paenibacillus ehimensis TaxID=79264 RepID=UPI00046FD5A1|nr:tail protein X [Paenibacillus ehimensis]
MTDSIYTTIQGDMWDGIAKKVLGAEKHMTLLIEANPEYRETVIFPAGIALVIPAIAAPITSQLPPWKRGEAG